MKLCAWKAVCGSATSSLLPLLTQTLSIGDGNVRRANDGPAPPLPKGGPSLSKLAFDCFCVVLPAAMFRLFIKDPAWWVTVRNTSSSASWGESGGADLKNKLILTRCALVEKRKWRLVLWFNKSLIGLFLKWSDFVLIGDTSDGKIQSLLSSFVSSQEEMAFFKGSGSPGEGIIRL